MEVAGPALISLFVSVFFYWALVILIEKGVCSCRRRGALEDRESLV